MEIFKTNYTFNYYDDIEINNFKYDENNCTFFYPLLFPYIVNIKDFPNISDNIVDIKSVIFTNPHSLKTIREYNLYYSLFFIVNKHIWSKKKYFDKITLSLVEKKTDSSIDIIEAIKLPNFPLKYYSLKYVIINKKIVYSNINDYDLTIIIKSILIFANTLGILSSDNRNNKYKLSSLNLISNNPIVSPFLLSLSLTVQLKVFIEWIRKKTIIVTGTTGIGKSSVVPKLFFYISYLLDGYTDYTVFDIDNYSLEKKVFLALPRKLLVKDMGLGITKSLNLNITNNDLIQLQFKDIRKAENKMYYNISEKNKMILATSQSLFKIINDCSLLICDEIHEHSNAIDTLINISRILKIQLVLISATIEQDKETINKFFPNYSYIHIKGPTRYPITSIAYKIINKNNYKNKNIILEKTKDILDKYLKKYLRVGETCIVFLPSTSWIKQFERMLKYDDAEFKQLRKDIKNYSDNVIKYFELDKKKKHIIISTPIAESSITVNNLKLVIDTGLFFDTSYDALNINLISYSSHIQRKGRVGRNASGIYISLFDPEILDKSLKKEIDGQRIFTSILFLHHYLQETTNRVPTIEEIKKNYIFPPKDKNRIEEVYQYLSSKNLLQFKYSSLIITGLTCNIIEYLYLYYKYKDTDIYYELKSFEENEEPVYKISDTLFRELYSLNKKIYHVNGKCYYSFYNDREKYFNITRDKKNILIDNRYYRIIKYNSSPNHNKQLVADL
jgi:hypothetical protein